MTSIGIVGTGISGLQLALTLQQAGIGTTLYAERTPDEMRASRLPNTVTRFGPTLARERALGVDYWSEHNYRSIDVSILDTPVAFTGQLHDMASNIDFRVYLPRLLEDYAARGGHVVTGTRSVEDIVAGTSEHDLTVVAAGRESVAALFPRDAARSPFHAPQRILTAALLHGIAPPEPTGVNVVLIPGIGEIFVVPYVSRHGVVTAVLMESVPGGPLEAVSHMRYHEDPKGFDALHLDLLRRFAPKVYDRVDPAAYGVTGPTDVLQGAIVPTVRKPYCEVAPGRFVVAVGDAYVANDPVGGQGANLGSASVEVVADAILRDVAYDEWFCRSLARDLWTIAEPVTNFNNAFLAPPPPHVQELMGAAMMDQSVADAFCNLWAAPADMWRTIATPERSAAFIARAAAPPAAMAA